MKFTRLSALPTELRLKIWNAALRQGARSWWVVVQGLDMTVSTKNLCPLLTVNCESRMYALAFYPCAIDLYTMENRDFRDNTDLGRPFPCMHFPSKIYNIF